MTGVGRLGVAVALSALATGCTGWATGTAGMSYSAAGRVERSGPLVGTDQFFKPRPRSRMNPSDKPWPVGLHNSLQVTVAPDLKTLGWGTGIALFGDPRPVTGFAVLGTNLHVDIVDGKGSFGNFHPYGEVGLAAPLSSREPGVPGLMGTFSLQGAYLLHYGVIWRDEPGPVGDPLISFKFGIGWELAGPAPSEGATRTASTTPSFLRWIGR